MVTDTGFFLPGQNSSPIVLENLMGGTTDGSISAEGFLDESNGEFAMGGGPLLSTTPMAFGSGPFSGVVNATDSLGGLDPFSLTENITVTHTAGGQISTFTKQLTAEVVAASEPGTLLLLGTGLLGLAGYGWRRQKPRKERSRI
jgi:hypothetical protein